MRRTKLIATLGPSTDAPGVLDALMAAGLNVARINMSHATRESVERQFSEVRAASRRADRHVGVVLDLGGAKLRLGEVAPGTVLAEGTAFVLYTAERVGDVTGASVSHAGLADDVGPGDRLLVDDGRIELRVSDVRPGEVTTTVVVGGPLSSRKGVNVPGVRLSLDSITPRDLEALARGLDLGVDMVAQSFVRSAEDVERLRAAMGERVIPIIAKIEKHEAVDDLDAIVEAADAVMVARGDLGVELPLEEVPGVQRRIIAACRAAGKPVIVATQMLESMTEASRPTRAEASDVANAIYGSVDAVMLSGETAVGAHPALVLSTMDRIVRAAEQVAVEHGPAPRPGSGEDVSAAVSRAVCELAESLDLGAIVTATQSGATARSVAAYRPQVPVLAVTPNDVIARQLTVVWGVRPVVVDSYATTMEMIDAAAAAVRESGLAMPGELVAITGGVDVHVTGSTNLIQVHRI